MVKKQTPPSISIVVPVFNEAPSLEMFHKDLLKTTASLPAYSFSIMYVDDGSRDDSAVMLRRFSEQDPRTSVLTLSRNFGKEYALTAGITESSADAIITLDADGQHPVELIGSFLEKWQQGAQVVVGVRENKHSLKSRAFYALFNKLSSEKLTLDATDFRLIDKEVQEAFVTLRENGRITRGLIDWLGFESATVPFKPKKRSFGTPTYSTRNLIRLAIHSFVSMSNLPLYIFGSLGIIITSLSGLLGLTVIIEQLLLRDPLNWNFTGTAMLGILILFLIGIVLMSQGILSLYISSIHRESKDRPLYVINWAKSRNVKAKRSGK